MSLRGSTVESAVTGATDGSATPPAERSWLRRNQWPIALALLVLVALALTALLTPRTRAGDLDPESAQPQGSRAVVQILGRQGVDVRVARRAADVVRAGTTTYLVNRPDLVPLRVWDELAATGADLVVVQPDLVALGALGLPVEPAGTVDAQVRAPGCEQPDAVAAGRTAAGGQLYRLVGDAAGPSGALCYRDEQDPAAGSYAVVDDGDRTVTLIGQADILRNETLAQQGNAALALRSLGRGDRLVWYVPNPLDLAAEAQGPTLAELLPDGLRWAALQLGIVVLVVLLWRGRRLGRLVTEPLPVVVRAAETQEGRARLYRQARARGRAAATLRTAALRRLARRFDAAPDSDPAALAARVAAATGRTAEQVHDVLLGPAPADDAALVRLADDLDAIEKDVAK